MHDGLDLETVAGDMANLSTFTDATFDLIVHPGSNRRKARCMATALPSIDCPLFVYRPMFSSFGNITATG